MLYKEFVELYEELASTTKRLEKTAILAKFFGKLKKEGRKEFIYLLRGRVLPDYDSRELGISGQLVTKAMTAAWGISGSTITTRYRKVGDFGDLASEFAAKRKQSSLFSKALTVGKVFDNLTKIMMTTGKGSVDKKLALIAELLTSATPSESRYIIRTLLNDLRVGVAEAIVLDSVAEAFYPGEGKGELVHDAYYLANDLASVFAAAAQGLATLGKIGIVPGKPLNVMLPVKVTEIGDAFEICGRPAALEHKYDGFRTLIHYDGKELSLFTRKLENVTNQFPDVVAAIKKHVSGKSFILDSEVVGYDPKTHAYKPFEAISQRIKRKHDIDRLVKELPVEINVFDVIYHNGKSIMHTSFTERRKLLEKIIKTQYLVIKPSFQLVTGDDAKALAFYKEALKIGEEGIMIKKIDAPYHPGRRVGYIVKLKPESKDFDLVIVGAEYGSGKRAGLLTSYIVACKNNGEYQEVGMVSSGLKEKSEEGITYEEMTNLLKPLITKETGTRVHVRPKLIVSVTYQNIQPSPSYNSGFAMRFPRITHYRPDRNAHDIATLEDLEKEAKKQQRY